MSTETTPADWFGIALGAFGTLLASLDLILILLDRRQHVAILRLPGHAIRFRVTNHTRRPIPLQSIEIYANFPGGTPSTQQWPTRLHGLELPGMLAPEACVEAEPSTDDLIGMILSGTFRLVVESQTGKSFKSKREKIVPTNASRATK